MRRGDKMNNYVIIGNSIAAAGCIEGIRTVDKESKIVIISKENRPVYCRPLISYYLEGKTTIKKMDYRPENFYEANGCEVIYNVEATKIDSEKKSVSLSNGDSVSYTSLCIAAGSSPFVPPFEGIENVTSRFSFMTTDDALALEKAVNKNSRVLIIGAGLIGLKCAEGLLKRAAKITVCDLADKVLSSILDADTAPIVQKHLEENGVELLLSDSVKSFEANKAFMQSGKCVDFDVLVTAVGVRANTSLLKDIGGDVARGIKVDDSMKTSIKDIYSAGDCTESFDISFGQSRVLALLPNAYMQGYTAGCNMAGGSEVFSNAIPMNSIGFFNLHIMTAGSYITDKDGGEVYTEKGSGFVKKFFVKDNLLKGYILVGNVEKGGIYTSLIREKTPLDTVNFDLLKKHPSFMAFSSENRSKKFGGVV